MQMSRGHRVPRTFLRRCSDKKIFAYFPPIKCHTCSIYTCRVAKPSARTGPQKDIVMVFFVSAHSRYKYQSAPFHRCVCKAGNLLRSAFKRHLPLDVTLEVFYRREMCTFKSHFHQVLPYVYSRQSFPFSQTRVPRTSIYGFSPAAISVQNLTSLFENLHSAMVHPCLHVPFCWDPGGFNHSRVSSSTRALELGSSYFLPLAFLTL